MSGAGGAGGAIHHFSSPSPRAYGREPGNSVSAPPPPPSHQPKLMAPQTPISDPLIVALARYVEALHRRYPEGPEQMRRESLDGRAIITAMYPPKKDTAA